MTCNCQGGSFCCKNQVMYMPVQHLIHPIRAFDPNAPKTIWVKAPTAWDDYLDATEKWIKAFWKLLWSWLPV